MTAEEFKALKPELAHLEGDDLWNAMEDYFISQQAGQEILNSIKPFYKRYRLRYLFYKSYPNRLFGKNDYTASNRCTTCKKGVSMYMSIFNTQEKTSESFCPHGDHLYVAEPNTGTAHKLHNQWLSLQKIVFRVLKFSHILKIGERYGMVMGDEWRYVKAWQINFATGITTPIHKKRKWWEYIIIEK